MSTQSQAQDLQAQFHAGALSANEYKELLEDLKHTAAIEEAAGDLNKLSQIHEMLEDLKNAASVL
jgi:polyhydroxyalkanoate synthesis regulator phasin